MADVNKHIDMLDSQLREIIRYIFPQDGSTDSDPLVGYPPYPVYLNSANDAKALRRKDIFRQFVDRDGAPEDPLSLPPTPSIPISNRDSQEADQTPPGTDINSVLKLCKETDAEHLIGDVFEVSLENRWRVKTYRDGIREEIERYENDTNRPFADMLAFGSSDPQGDAARQVTYAVVGEGLGGRLCWWYFEISGTSRFEGPVAVGYFTRLPSWTDIDSASWAWREDDLNALRRNSIFKIRALWKVKLRPVDLWCPIPPYDAGLPCISFPPPTSWCDLFPPPRYPNATVPPFPLDCRPPGIPAGRTPVDVFQHELRYRLEPDPDQLATGRIQLIRYRRPPPDMPISTPWVPPLSWTQARPATPGPPGIPDYRTALLVNVWGFDRYPTTYDIEKEIIQKLRDEIDEKALSRLGDISKDIGQFAAYYVRAAAEDYIREWLEQRRLAQSPPVDEDPSPGTPPSAPDIEVSPETQSRLDLAREIYMNLFQEVVGPRGGLAGLAGLAGSDAPVKTWTPVSWVFSKVQGANYIREVQDPDRGEGLSARFDHLSAYGPFHYPKVGGSVDTDYFALLGREYRELTADDLTMDSTEFNSLKPAFDAMPNARLHRRFIRTDLSREGLSRALTALAYLYMTDLIKTKIDPPPDPDANTDPQEATQPGEDPTGGDLASDRNALNRMEEIRSRVTPIVRYLYATDGKVWNGPGSHVSYSLADEAGAHFPGPLRPFVRLVLKDPMDMIRGSDAWYVYLIYRIAALMDIETADGIGFDKIAAAHAKKRSKYFKWTSVTIVRKLRRLQKKLKKRADGGWLRAIGIALGIGGLSFPFVSTGIRSAYFAAAMWAYDAFLKYRFNRLGELYHGIAQELDNIDPILFMETTFPMKTEPATTSTMWTELAATSTMRRKAADRMSDIFIMDRWKADPLVTAAYARSPNGRRSLFGTKLSYIEDLLMRILAHVQDAADGCSMGTVSCVVYLEHRDMLIRVVSKGSRHWSTYHRVFVGLPAALYTAPYGRFYSIYHPEEADIQPPNDRSKVWKKADLLRGDLADEVLPLGHDDMRGNFDMGPLDVYVAFPASFPSKKYRFTEWEKVRQHRTRPKPIYWEGRGNVSAINPYKYNPDPGNKFYFNVGEALLARALLRSAELDFPQ
ncbi:MAG: hypothetical protein O7H41_20735 [Planctomycetota bacterium]|nr:hypothetical protein [Planctomycetota bacterium]